ncbi:MAG: hypothetical protein R3E61_00135 [Pseudomonadales bacterium]
MDQDKLTKQIQIINEATETAESLPADLQDLKEARKKVESIGSEAIKTAAKISTAKENVDNLLSAIKSNKEESDKLVENCEDSYRITTSKGLAGAFDQRANQLAKSMWSGFGSVECACGSLVYRFRQSGSFMLYLFQIPNWVLYLVIYFYQL